MNENILNKAYRQLPDNYLFSTIARKITDYQTSHPGADIIRLGIGDVTRPLADCVIRAMYNAVEEMANQATFRGYGPEQGYLFLREAVAKGEYQSRNIDISPEEIFISDGSKCDVANFQELFNNDCSVAIPDPVYPVYLDSNIMAGRNDIIYLPCTAENNFQPELPRKKADIIYLCSPNNPTGTVLSRETLSMFVDYAIENGSVILYDAAYSAYIQDDSLIHSIYEIPGAEKCAVEFHSFSKTAGFTGVRCAVTTVPLQMSSLHKMWLRRQCTKFNGCSYIVQRGAEAVYSDEGKTQIHSAINGYMKNAKLIREKLQDCSFTVFGGEHAPYIWWKLPDNANSFEFFDRLLESCEVVGTPGSGFGKYGEGYFRLTAFGDPEQTEIALKRIENNLTKLRS